MPKDSTERLKEESKKVIKDKKDQTDAGEQSSNQLKL